MPRTPATPTADQVLALQLADVAVERANRALDAAKAQRDTVRKRYKALFVDGEWVDVPELGKRVRRRSKSTGRTFSLSRYEGKYAVTPEMEPFIGKGSTYDEWLIQDVVD
jgi:hypothetical protein